MNRFTGIFALMLFSSFPYSCKKDNSSTPSAAATGNYTVAFSLYSTQSKYLFAFTDINGSHIDTIHSNYDSITTVVSTGSDLQVLQSIKCLYPDSPDSVYIRAVMNGRSVSNSQYKKDTGNLVVGVQLQSLL